MSPAVVGGRRERMADLAALMPAEGLSVLLARMATDGTRLEVDDHARSLIHNLGKVTRRVSYERSAFALNAR